MDNLDRLLKEFLAQERQRLEPQGRITFDYPSVEDFYLYLTDGLGDEALQKMLEHLKKHPEDQAFVMKARKLLEAEGGQGDQTPSLKAVEMAKALLKEKTGLACPHCGGTITPFKKPIKPQIAWSITWIALAAASFTLSFLFRGYFMQFLALTLLFGVKWIVDRKAIKTQIIVYKALHDVQGDEISSRSKDLHRAPSHL